RARRAAADVAGRAGRVDLRRNRSDPAEHTGRTSTGPAQVGLASPGSVGTQAHRAGDGVELDLAGTAGDSGDDGFTPAKAHDALSGEAVPSEDLHAETGRGDVGFRPLQLGHGRLTGGGLATGDEPRGAVGEHPGGVDLG